VSWEAGWGSGEACFSLFLTTCGKKKRVLGKGCFPSVLREGRVGSRIKFPSNFFPSMPSLYSNENEQGF